MEPIMTLLLLDKKVLLLWHKNAQDTSNNQGTHPEEMVINSRQKISRYKNVNEQADECQL
jgi:hypothetical protein